MSWWQVLAGFSGGLFGALLVDGVRAWRLVKAYRKRGWK